MNSKVINILETRSWQDQPLEQQALEKNVNDSHTGACQSFKQVRKLAHIGFKQNRVGRACDFWMHCQFTSFQLTLFSHFSL